MKHFHYIFTGAGLSALMTVYQMVLSGKFRHQTILLLDENPKKTKDKTWCFWEEEDGNWDSIVHKKWETALFANETFQRDLNLKPYHYKMVRGLDFYNHVFELLSKQENITCLNQKVTEIEESGSIIRIETETESFSCNRLLNSIYNQPRVESQSEYPVLQRQFVGWTVKSEQAIFNPERVTFMDFSVVQKGNTHFFYVLPLSSTEALIQYTLLSKNRLSTEEYESEIQLYLQKLGCTQYEILEKEQESIPMTSYPFWEQNTRNVINIGSTGGWTKASTGYTFKNADTKSKALVAFLQTGKNFWKFHKKNKFWFYDLFLLDILNRKNEKGSEIFSSLFKEGNPALIFKFLDEKTSFSEDLHVILKCPKALFLEAVFQVAIKKIKHQLNYNKTL